MELLKGTAPEALFYHPTPSTTIEAVELSVDGVLVSPNPTYTTVDGVSKIQLPYLQSQNDIEVTWHFTINGETYEEMYPYEVVSPYLSKREVKEIWPTATDKECLEVESVVRHIINAHTGQSFGYSKNKTLVVEGHGDRALRLPERLIRLTRLATMNAVLDPNSAIIVSDGWYLKKGWSATTESIHSDNNYFGGSDVSNVPVGAPGYEKPGHGHIIYSPRAHVGPTAWRNDYPFTITGDWGYESVPVPVKEAAKLLVNDYACSEQLYRDRYLESIKAADWRLQFNSRAWENTGNVRADQLLSEYVLLHWAVI